MADPLIPTPDQVAVMRSRNATAAFTGDVSLLTRINTEDVPRLLVAVELLTTKTEHDLEQARVDRTTAEMHRDDYRTAHRTAVAAKTQLIAQLAAARADRDELQGKWAVLVERTLAASAVLATAEDPEVEEYLAPIRTDLLRKILDGDAGRDDLCDALVPKLAELERRHAEQVQATAERHARQVKRARDLAASLRNRETELKQRHNAATRDDQAAALLSAAALVGDIARQLEEALCEDGSGK